MRSILSLGLTALAACTSAVSAETTIAILEFGPGGSVHRTTATSTESNSVAVTSFWNAMHQPSKRGSMSQHTGMSVVPDLFSRADAGIIIGLKGESLKSMPTVASLLDMEAEDVDNVVGHVHVRGQAGADLLKRAASSKENVESIAKDDVGRRLQSAAETAARGELKGMETLSLAVDNDESAAAADEHLARMLKTLQKQAAANKKTVVVHLVAEEEGRRRLEGEDNENNQNNNNNQNYNEKTMYEIQTFNLYLWTSVGLVTIVFMVLSAFVAMPLMPDTLLFGETAKMVGSD